MYPQPALFTIITLKIYLNLTYRQIVEFISFSDILQKYLKIKRAPNYSILQKFFKIYSRINNIESVFNVIKRKYSEINKSKSKRLKNKETRLTLVYNINQLKKFKKDFK